MLGMPISLLASAVAYFGTPRFSDAALPEGATEYLALIVVEYGECGHSSGYRGDQLAMVPEPTLTGSSTPVVSTTHICESNLSGSLESLILMGRSPAISLECCCASLLVPFENPGTFLQNYRLFERKARLLISNGRCIRTQNRANVAQW